MKNFSLALGLAALVALVAGCGGGNAGSQLPSAGATQLVAYHQAPSGFHMDVQPDTGRSAKWWAYYYCDSSYEICRYHTSDYYGDVTTYIRSETRTWQNKKGPQDPWLALLITGNTAYTGVLTSATLYDQVNITTSGQHTMFGDFQSNNPPSCEHGTPPTARFFFISGGLFAYTHYWWSNPVSWTLAKQASTTTIKQVVNDPANWPDWNGHPGDYDHQTMTRFANAIAHVRWVGLSFGGGCFFENGVDVTGPKSAIFNSDGFSITGS